MTVLDPPGRGTRRGAGPVERVTADFRVEASRPVQAGIDGEAALLTPPVVFRIRPAAAPPVRIAAHHPAASPALGDRTGRRGPGAARALLRIAGGLIRGSGPRGCPLVVRQPAR